MKNSNCNAIAISNVAKMEKYIESTLLSAVPLNQFGRASRKHICKELEITYSTISSNAHLAAAFEKLDIILGAVAYERKVSSVKDHHHLQETIKLFEKHIAKLEFENRSLLCEMKRYDHFVNSGRMARQ